MLHEATPDLTSPIFSAGNKLPNLQPHHLRELRASGLSDDIIIAAGIFSETKPDRLVSLMEWPNGKRKQAPALVYPYIGPDGTNGYYRCKPDKPAKDRNGKAIKYESPRGRPNQVYFPPGVADLMTDASRELLITEGEKKSLRATQEGFPCIGLVGVYGWKGKGNERLLPALERFAWKGREVYIAFDSDLDRNEDVQQAESRLAKLLTDQGAKVRCVRIPDGPPDASGEPTKQGLDDFLVACGVECKRELRRLLNEAIEPLPVDGGVEKAPAKSIEPASEAKRYLSLSLIDDTPALRYWRDSFWWWSCGRYSPRQPSEVRGRLISDLNERYVYLKMSDTSNVLDQLKAQSILPYSCEPPMWIGPAPEGWHAVDTIAARNGIINLPRLVAGASDFLLPATPRFFTPAAIDFDFDPGAKWPPATWLEFLYQLWGDDAASIELLQEWFGYALTADTRLQKMLLLIGPPRSGKGTIARILRAVVGEYNVAGPTLASFATNFGLWPLLGKTLAIVSDARLSGRADQAQVVERLLSISGEDALTIDRKHQEPITTKLLTRIVILSNELPRLSDASGALANRFLMLNLSRSFLGQEDELLTEKLLAERAGILLWAVEGWRRLRQRRRFQQPTSGDDLRQQLDDLSSPVGAFVRECCEVGTGCQVTVAQIYAAWRTWCEEKGREPSTEATFGRDLAAALPTVKRTQPRKDGLRVYAYDGIRLR